MPNGGSENQIEFVGLDADVVRRVEPLALELVHQHRDRAVVFGARDPPRLVLAGDEAALAIATIAVGVVGRLAIDADRAGGLVVAHQPIVRDVAPDQATGVAEIDRPFAPAHAGREPLDAGVEQAIPVEAGVEAPDRGIGIALARLPAAEGGVSESHRGSTARRREHVASRHLHGVSPGCWLRPQRIVADLAVGILADARRPSHWRHPREAGTLR